MLAEACLVAADGWARRGDRARAEEYRGRARDTLQPLASTLKDRQYQLAWARTLSALGRAPEAAAIVNQLRSGGFRRDVLDAIVPPSRTVP
jgi:hypothetical protein